MTKPAGISEEAKAAVTEGDLWSLYFTDEIIDEIVTWTNQKIEYKIAKKNYSEDTLKKAPYISTTDKVSGFYQYFPVLWIRIQSDPKLFAGSGSDKF